MSNNKTGANLLLVTLYQMSHLDLFYSTAGVSQRSAILTVFGCVCSHRWTYGGSPFIRPELMNLMDWHEMNSDNTDNKYSELCPSQAGSRSGLCRKGFKESNDRNMCECWILINTTRIPAKRLNTAASIKIRDTIHQFEILKSLIQCINSVPAGSVSRGQVAFISGRDLRCQTWHGIESTFDLIPTSL